MIKNFLEKQLLLLLPLFILGCSDNNSNEACDILPSNGTQIENIIYTSAGKTLRRPMLVIRIEFTDYTFQEDENFWATKIFGGDSGQLNHYYNEISQQQFQFTPVQNGSIINGVTTIKLSTTHPNFTTKDSLWQQDITNRLHPLLANTLLEIRNQLNFKDYDTNNDNKISSDELLLTFILAGHEDAYQSYDFGSGVWAHQDCTVGSNVPTIDGVTLMDCNNNGNYAVFGSKHYDSPSMSHSATIGIIAHELGHSAFNLPDLYSGGETRIGYYGLMSNGSWGQANQTGFPGSSPTHMTPWSKIDVGWFSIQKKHVDSTSFIELSATGTPNYNIIKSPIFNSNNEYFLLENRGAIGYDQGLKYINPKYRGGIAIWHIDTDVINKNRASNTVNADVHHKGVDIEEAAGSSADVGTGDPLTNLYYSNNVDAFTPNTSPNTNLYNGEHSYIFFTEISSLGTVMNLKINNPKEAP